MFLRLPTRSVRLSELFASSHTYAVPAYQRPYSWTVLQAGQLLDDITLAAGIEGEDEAETDYFLGSILLLDALPEAQAADRARDAPRKLEIVDGQQRLVTLTILAAALRDLASDDRSEIANRLDLLVNQETSASKKNPGWVASIVARSTRSREDAFDTVDAEAPFRMWLRGQQHEILTKFVQERGACLREVPEDLSENNQECTILAVRGALMATLSTMDEDQRDTLANFLCDFCHFVVIEAKDVDRALRMFIVLNGRGMELKRKDILKAEVLRSVSFKDADLALAIWSEAERKIGSRFEDFFSQLRAVHGYGRKKIIAGVREVIQKCGGPLPFLRNEFAPLANAYHKIVNARDPDIEMTSKLRRHLVGLLRLNGTDWMPATMLVIRNSDLVGGKAESIVAEIERLAYAQRLLCLGASRRTIKFARIVAALDAGEIQGGDLSLFKIKRVEVRTISHNLKDLYSRNPQICKQLLLRLNDELESNPVLVAPSDYTVEHVLARRPATMSDWRKKFPDAEQRLACMTSLGNLVLISEAQNDRARNAEFTTKKKVIQGSGQGARNGILEITRDAFRADTWVPEEVEARDARLRAMITKLWRIDVSKKNT